MEQQPKVVFRTAGPDDMAFVVSNYSFQYTNLTKDERTALVTLKLREAKTTVAEVNGNLVGFVVYQAPYVQFVYVKHAHRTIGWAKALIKNVQGTYKPVLTRTLPKKKQLRAKLEKLDGPGAEAGVWILKEKTQ